MLINNIKARKELNSRKEETIAVTIETTQGKFEAIAPSGKSRGKNEAEPFSKKGINFSIDFVNVLGKKIIHDKMQLNEFNDLKTLEEEVRKFDKTKNYSVIGANALFALEAALLKAMAAAYAMPLWKFLNENPRILPMPLGNCIGGGQHIKLHDGHPEKRADFQEFLLLPQTEHFFDAYFINLQAYKDAKIMLSGKDKDWRGDLTDENALAATLDNDSILALLSEVVKKIKADFKIKITIGLDMAASSFWKSSHYEYKNPCLKKLNKEEQLKYVTELIEKYSLSYVEDPFHEEDFESFSKLLKILKKKNIDCLITGDDLICTQKERLERAIKEQAINAVIIKPNQNGSLIETKEVVDLAKKNNIIPVISHRSGETSDNTIAHLAVGWQIPIIKTGILGKERFAKLHELLRIERSVFCK